MNNTNNLYTDLSYDMERNRKNIKIINKNKDIKVLRNINYTTIFFNNYNNLDKVFSMELKRYLKKINNEKILVVGLGNSNSTPDSLGPNTINKILVTGYLNDLNGYSNVCCLSPGVVANTGIETSKIIKAIVKEIKITKLIVIDSLKTNNINHLGKTIQINNLGITPGSGINNNRLEISKNTIGCDVIAIGIPTVVDIRNINRSINNYIVTPTNIDYLIDVLSFILSQGINISLHKNFIRQNN